MKPHLTPEERAEQKKKFWIVPGVAVVRVLDDRPVMSVVRIRNRRVKETVGPCPFCKDLILKIGHGPVQTMEHPPTPERQFCEDGKLKFERNITDGIEVQWIDADQKLQRAVFQVKELKPWKSDDDKKLAHAR